MGRGKPRRKEGFRLTESQYRFAREGKSFLRDALEAGKERGVVHPAASISLVIDPEPVDPYSGAVRTLYSKVGRERRPVSYQVTIPPESLGDWSVLEHEAGHIALGHPEKGIGSARLLEEGNFEDYVLRELSAVHRALRATKSLDLLDREIARYVAEGVHSFALPIDYSFSVVREIARKLGISFQYIKSAKDILREAGYWE